MIRLALGECEDFLQSVSLRVEIYACGVAKAGAATKPESIAIRLWFPNEQPSGIDEGGAIAAGIVDQPGFRAAAAVGVGNLDDRPAPGIKADRVDLEAWAIEPRRLRAGGEVDSNDAVARRTTASQLGRRRITGIDAGSPRIAASHRLDKGDLHQLAERAGSGVHEPDTTRKLFECVREEVDALRVEVGDGRSVPETDEGKQEKAAAGDEPTAAASTSSSQRRHPGAAAPRRRDPGKT